MYWSAIRNKSARCSSMQMRSVHLCVRQREKKGKEEEEKEKKLWTRIKGIDGRVTPDGLRLVLQSHYFSAEETSHILLLIRCKKIIIRDQHFGTQEL